MFDGKMRHSGAILLVILAAWSLLPGEVVGQETTRVSIGPLGEEGNSSSFFSSISDDGRFVAYESWANNIVSGDNNDVGDIFVHDRQTGQTVRVSVSSEGVEGNAPSWSPSISADGRFVAFGSWASNLVSGDTNGTYDVFVHDRQTGQTVRVSVSSGGVEGNAFSGSPSISGDGNVVAFVSRANNLVAGDTNNEWDAFVHDLQTGETVRVNVTSGGEESNGGFWLLPVLSGDGRFVVFSSSASNLVPGDTNGEDDVFVHDRSTGETTRVSVGTGGEQGNSFSEGPSISDDGRFVVFDSLADNLVPGDDNGSIDIFLRDRQTGETTIISGYRTPATSGASPLDGVISRDGSTIAFWVILPDEAGIGEAPRQSFGVFVYRRTTGSVRLVSTDWLGQRKSGFSPSISADGTFVSFFSPEALVAADSNFYDDVYVHGPIVFAGGTGSVVAAPAVTEWGTLVFGVLAALGALYALRRAASIQ